MSADKLKVVREEKRKLLVANHTKKFSTLNGSPIWRWSKRKTRNGGSVCTSPTWTTFSPRTPILFPTLIP